MVTAKWQNMNWNNVQGNIWAGTSLVVGRCNVCGAKAGSIVRWGDLGPLMFYCQQHYRDIIEGRTQWHELVELVTEAVSG